MRNSDEDADRRAWDGGRSRLPFQIRRFVGRSGAEVVVLIDSLSGPAFYPDVFITCRFVKTGRSPNTQERVLRSMGRARAWASSKGRALDEWVCGTFLNDSDVESLADWLRLSTDEQAAKLEQAQSPKRRHFKVHSLESMRPSPRAIEKHPTEGASAEDAAARIRWVADYLEWHLEFLMHKTDSTGKGWTDSLIVVGPQVIDRLRKSAQGMGGLTRDDETLEGIPQDIVERITYYLQPEHPENPFTTPFTRARNYLLWTLLASSGSRRGEVWRAKVGDISYTERCLNIKHSKTTPRRVSISASAADAFDTFILEHWSRLPKEARSRGFIFTDEAGRALSLRSLTNIFHRIREAINGVPAWLTSQTLRKTWNDRFSELVDATPIATRMSSEQEISVRNRLMGWSPNSDMATRYAARTIRRKTDAIGEALANKIGSGIRDVGASK